MTSESPGPNVTVVRGRVGLGKVASLRAWNFGLVTAPRGQRVPVPRVVDPRAPEASPLTENGLHCVHARRKMTATAAGPAEAPMRAGECRVPPDPPAPTDRRLPGPCPALPPRTPSGPAPRLLSELLEELVLVREPGAGGGGGHPRAGLPGWRCPRPGCPRARSLSASESGWPRGLRGAGVTREGGAGSFSSAPRSCRSCRRRTALFQPLSPDGRERAQ